MTNLYSYGMEPIKRSLTVAELLKNRGQRKYTQVTASNKFEAAAAFEAGIDTLSCGLDEYAEVRSGAPDAFIITALPATEFISETEVVRAGLKVMEAGSDAVFTARSLHLVEALAREGVPVMSHLGMSPRKSTWYGGLRAQGKTADDALRLFQQFRDLENAGAFAAEVELVCEQALAEIAKRSSLVTFTLGSGSAGDVVFLYSCDILGEVEKLPRHSKAYANLRQHYAEAQATRVQAFRAFQSDVVQGGFPSQAHSVQMPEEELQLLAKQLNDASI